jgi:hypothetical protein
MSEICSDRSRVVSSLNSQRKAFLASFSYLAPGGIFSVTMTTLRDVFLGRVDGWASSSYIARWCAICLKLLTLAEKKQKTSIKGKRRWE